MNWDEMKKKATQHGFEFVAHRGRHDEYYNPETKATALVPRHGSAEVKKKTEANIRQKLFGA